MTYLLIGLNVLITLMAFSGFRKQDRPERFLFIPYQVARGENLSGMLVSHFSHADLGHLLFNMITLYFFAPVVEHGIGEDGLLVVYGLSGLLATVFVYFLHKNNPSYRALGASDSVSGVIFAAIVIYPGMNIYFFLIPIPIPAPLFAVGYLLLSTYFMKRQVGNISHEAHIGGAVTGFLVGGLMYESGFEPLITRLKDLLS